MKFGVEASIGDFFQESIYLYDKGIIRLIAYLITDIVGDFIPTVHDDFQLVELCDLLKYNLAPADIPIAESIVKYLNCEALCSK